MKEIVMPKLGLTMTEGTVARLAQVRRRRRQEGEPLFDVETDKLTNTIEASASGKLLAVYVPAGESAKCLEKVCAIGAEGETPPAAPRRSRSCGPGRPREGPRGRGEQRPSS